MHAELEYTVPLEHSVSGLLLCCKTTGLVPIMQACANDPNFQCAHKFPYIEYIISKFVLFVRGNQGFFCTKTH